MEDNLVLAVNYQSEQVASKRPNWFTHLVTNKCMERELGRLHCSVFVINSKKYLLNKKNVEVSRIRFKIANFI
jgi:hypothetical protein